MKFREYFIAYAKSLGLDGDALNAVDVAFIKYIEDNFPGK